MRKKKIVMMMLALTFILGGCAGNLPQSERSMLIQDNFGLSQEMVTYNQTLDPEAGLKPELVEGHDGRTADISVEGYRDTYREIVDPAEAIEALRHDLMLF